MKGGCIDKYFIYLSYKKKLKKEITVKKISENDFKRLHSIIYQGENPEWKKWDGPYYDDYKFTDYENFLKDKVDFFKSDNVKGIYIDGILMGTVSRYWEDRKTRWIEVGIVIYDSNYWYGGYGSEALKIWTTKTFDDFPELEHIGLTTWSGNISMMKSAEKIGYKLEGRIRKVRYHMNEYFDSMKYGVLREEWESLK